MTSFWSRLGSLLRQEPQAAEAPPSEPAGEARPVQDWREKARETTRAQPVPARVRIGIDFGTSTTQVAYRVGSNEPRMLRLDGSSTAMPSYFAIGPDGVPLFGSAAMNYPESIHSIKLRLPEDAPIAELDGMRPSEVAFLMLEEVVRRAIVGLRAQRAIPADAERLDVATNLGCTPRFTLEHRLRLRNVARKAGLNVLLADLVEEPVAAGFELVRSAAAPEGTLLVIDIGGGTMDVAVLRSDLGKQRVDLYATSGHELGGDQYTAVIERRIREEVERRTGRPVATRRDETLIWSRAEAAKLALTARPRVLVPLGGIADLPPEDLLLDRDWFMAETRRLVYMTTFHVQQTWRVARLVLARGGEDDPRPGSIFLREISSGYFVRLTDVGLEDDASRLVDGVILVGGGSEIPAIRDRFRQVFGAKLLDPRDLAVEPVDAIVLGLARGADVAAVNLRFPNWGVSAVFRDAAGTPDDVPLYEPFSPSFSLSAGETATYSVIVRPPETATSVALAFRPVGPGDGVQWAEQRLPQPCGPITFQVDLFGHIRFQPNGFANLAEGRRAPWAPEDGGWPMWMPRPRRDGLFHPADDWRQDTV